MFAAWRWGTNLFRTVVSSCLAWGNSRLRVVVVVLLVPVEATARCFLCLCVQLGGFLVYLPFCASFFSDLFRWTSKVCLVTAVGRAILLGRVISGGLRLGMLRRIIFVSCSFFCFSWPLGHRKAS